MIAMSFLLGGCFQAVAEYTAPDSIVSQPSKPLQVPMTPLGRNAPSFIS
jgi:hypothetical protein